MEEAITALHLEAELTLRSIKHAVKVLTPVKPLSAYPINCMDHFARSESLVDMHKPYRQCKLHSTSETSGGSLQNRLVSCFSEAILLHISQNAGISLDSIMQLDLHCWGLI